MTNMGTREFRVQQNSEERQTDFTRREINKKTKQELGLAEDDQAREYGLGQSDRKQECGSRG